MATRHVYLRIEEIAGYTPVEPSPHGNYRRDCMRNTGHEDGTIPLSEVNARRLNALIYREYLDPDYLIPKPDKLVLADVNEPVYTHRVPGTVIYTKPGERLNVHVFNADTMPHSFHLHGLRYGIDSDGSWPFGTQSSDGRRSDEICPGQSWTYRFEVTGDMIGAWPFHDHSRHIGESVNRGLFGGIVVLPQDHEHPHRFTLPPLVQEYVDRCCREHPDDDNGHDHEHTHIEPGHFLARHHGGHGHGGGAGHGHGEGRGKGRNVRDPEHRGVLDFLEEWAQLEYAHPKPEREKALHVPLFFHMLSRTGGTPAFNSGPFSPAAPPFEVTLGAEATYSYHCEIHQQMQGRVVVAAGEAAEVTVSIEDTDMLNMRFNPTEVRVQPGGLVRWTPGTMLHTVTEDGAGIPSPAFNGRTFIGNTPTVVAEAGQKIRWYVFNLDLGMNWHNFHPHAQRWRFAQENIDVRSIGPAESFVVETEAPPVLLLPPEIDKTQKDRPKHARRYDLCGDFLVHCHVEMHMMQGLAALVRSRQTVWLTDEQAKRLEETIGLPTHTCDNSCPDVDPHRCEQFLCGQWEVVSGSPEVCMMHAALMPGTSKVMFFGYGDTRDDLSRVWDHSPAPGAYSVPANQPFDVSQPVHDRGLANIWSAEHAYLADPGDTLLVHGGFTPRETYLFNHGTATWSRRQPTAHDRFYSTTLTLPDGKLLTLFGSASKSFEVYDPATGTWSAPVMVPLPAMAHHQYYPWAYFVPGGKIFIAGPHGPTQRFDWTLAGISNIESFPSIAGDRSSGGEKGTSVLLPLRPPTYEAVALIAGGDFAPAQQTAEWINLSSPAPTWEALPNLNVARPQQVNSVLLPDGRVLVVGGVDGADGGPAEIFDPSDPTAGWELCATMSIPRGYHSTAILLADGSVLMGGDKPGQWKSGETTPNERYYPSYFTLSRPEITAAPASVTYGAAFSITTPSPASIAEVVIIRPGAVTHGFNMSQRIIECQITGTTATEIQMQAPPSGDIAPPGPYLLFILTASRVPSTGRWIHLG